MRDFRSEKLSNRRGVVNRLRLSLSPMSRAPLTCDDCFFRRAELCAIPGNTPCPTFRAVKAGKPAPPRQATLVARPTVVRRVAAA